LSKTAYEIFKGSNNTRAATIQLHSISIILLYGIVLKCIAIVLFCIALHLILLYGIGIALQLYCMHCISYHRCKKR